MPDISQALSQKRVRELDQLCARLGVTFGRMGLLNEALTHSSFAAEGSSSKDNERFEFFGDAILRFVISEYLLERFPEHNEGQLSEIRSVLVSDKTLAEIAGTLNLSKYILLGHQVQMRPSIMAQCMEAVICAVYTDLGLIMVQNLIVRLFGSLATSVDRDDIKDNYKKELQEVAQGSALGSPTYEVDSVDGPPHDCIFHVTAIVAGKRIASGSGRSKRAAEQEAARATLLVLGDSLPKPNSSSRPKKV